MEGPTADKLRLIVRVDKKEAAIAQLKAAIFLWFCGGDAVFDSHTGGSLA